MTVARHIGTAACLLLALAACSKEPETVERSTPKTTASADKPALPVGEQPGTPMAERVAVIGLLNKRNGQTRDFELKPGEAVRLDKVVIRLRACEKTAPWESSQDQGAFVQLIVRQRPPGTNDAERWAQVFSGWLFKENPAANVVEHPIYDVWVKECRMAFPGDDAPLDEETDQPAPAKRSSAPQSPAPAPAPAPADGADSGEGEATDEA